jgi:hypothetical protein
VIFFLGPEFALCNQLGGEWTSLKQSISVYYVGFSVIDGIFSTLVTLEEISTLVTAAATKPPSFVNKFMICNEFVTTPR